MTRTAVARILVAALGVAAAGAQAQDYYDDRGGYYDDGYAYDAQYDAQYDDRYDDRYVDARAGYAYGAGSQGPAYDMARVIAVDPMIERMQPVQREECWTEPPQGYARYDDRYGRPGQPRTTGGGAVVGALVGGALGNTVGRGDGRRAATVLGAVIGGAIGNDVERSNLRNQDAYYGRGGYQQPVSRCRVVTDQPGDDRVVGYRVSYEYAGRTYETTTDYHPGSTIRVRVDVTPEG